MMLLVEDILRDYPKIDKYVEQREASRVLKISQGNINNVIKGRYNQVGGYWFTNDDENAADVINHKLYPAAN